MEKTGKVKVYMTWGGYRVVAAESFGHAASQIDEGQGSILRFEWTTEEVGSYNTATAK